MGNETYSSHVDALISWYALNDFVEEAIREKMPAERFCEVNMITQEELRAVWPEREVCVTDILLRRKAAEDMDYVQAMNPMQYIDRNFPFALFQHGMEDPVVPCGQTETIVRKIRQICGEDRAELDLVPDAGHGAPAFKCNENMERCLAFLRNHVPCRGEYPGEMPEIRTVNAKEKVLLLKK